MSMRNGDQLYGLLKGAYADLRAARLQRPRYGSDDFCVDDQIRYADAESYMVEVMDLCIEAGLTSKCRRRSDAYEYLRCMGEMMYYTERDEDVFIPLSIPKATHLPA